MSRTRNHSKIISFLEPLCNILPMAFWGLILLGFEEKSMAAATLICALIHELGHIISILFIQKSDFSFRSVANGLRIRSQGLRSYDEEIITYLSGPLANLLVCAVCLVVSTLTRGFLFFMAIINLATALSNLLPIRGYDGYGALKAFFKKRDESGTSIIILSRISSSLIFIFCIFSLYLIDRYDGGYWIFGVFFISMIKEFDEGLKAIIFEN